MAKVYISEYKAMAAVDRFPAALEPSEAEQTPVAIGGASVQSAAFGATTLMVRIHTDAICSIAFGSSPTATANSKRMAADTTEYFGVKPGDRVAVITNT